MKGLKGDRRKLREKMTVVVRLCRTLGLPGVWRLLRRIMQRTWLQKGLNSNRFCRRVTLGTSLRLSETQFLQPYTRTTQRGREEAVRPCVRLAAQCTTRQALSGK